MPRLKKIHKELIICSLAENYESKEVQNRLRKDFGIDVPLHQISYYNPELNSSIELSKKWRSLYWQKKEEYRKELAKHPVTDKAYRMGMMNRAAHEYMKEGQYLAMLKVLDQAAKEMGGYYKDIDQVEGGGEGDNYTSIQAIMQKVNQRIEETSD